jgi:hypothetical protein
MTSLVTRPPDWLDPAAYRHLLSMDRAGFAWELLRRNADYRLEAARGAGKVRETRLESGSRVLTCAGSVAAGRWGLLFP